MKKFFLMAILAIVSLTASAQIDRGSRWGMTLPMGLSSYSEVSGSGNVFAMGIEVVYEYNFTKYFYISTGIGSAFRGSKIDHYFGRNVDGDLRSINLTLPVNIGGRCFVSDKAAIYGQVGAYGSLMASPASIDLGAYEAKGKDSDWGLAGRIGIEMSKIQIFGGYECGMQKVWEDSKNNTIIFGIGYMF